MDMESRRDECGVDEVESFRTFGFAVLRRFFDPGPLAMEVDRVLSEGLTRRRPHTGEIRFQYVPMMTAETPASLSLLDRVGAVAEMLLERPVLPTRAKGTRYFGESPWHVDSSLPVKSLGSLAYLDPTGPDSGALRVMPGSHHSTFNEALRDVRAARMRDPSLPGHVVATDPGDVILMDEHVLHAAFGGGVRRQWRVDYLGVPVGSDEIIRAKSYFARLYKLGWDGGYDVDQYPSYGPDWRRSGRAAVTQLEALGVYEAASAHEAFIRSRPGS
jgi:phytanoyl-CoA dioxygenase PhyH